MTQRRIRYRTGLYEQCAVCAQKRKFLVKTRTRRGVESIVEVQQPGILLHRATKKGNYSAKIPCHKGDYIIACEELLRDDDDDDERTFYLMNTNAFDGRNDGSDRRREINSSEIRISRVLKAGEDYVELDNDLTELVQGRSVPRIKLTQKLENEILSRCLGSLE